LLISFAATAIVVWVFVVMAEIRDSPIMGEPAAATSHGRVSRISDPVGARPWPRIDAG
jgi:hypothetical protein